MSTPAEYLRKHVRHARAVYAKHAVGWSLAGALGFLVSIATFSTSTRLSGMAGGLALTLPVGIWMAFRWRAMGEDGPVMRLITEPHHIVWHYPRVESVQNRSGRELKRSHQIFIGDDDGVLSSFLVEEEDVERVVKLLIAIAPHATAGFSEEMARAYREEPLDLRKAIPVDPVLADAAGGPLPYRTAPERVDPAGDPRARLLRRRARRRRRIAVIALAVGSPILVIGAWIAGAQAEVNARARRNAERLAWWSERAPGVLAHEATMAAQVNGGEPLSSSCTRRLDGQDWAALAAPSTRADGSVEIRRREARGSSAMSSIGDPSDGTWTNTLSEALGTAPWRWIVTSGAHPDPLFYGRLLDGPADQRRALVRVVDRETGALLCQGTVHVSSGSYAPPCADPRAWSDPSACAAASREAYFTMNALESAARSAMWSD
jgi:hypothetical protein